MAARNAQGSISTILQKLGDYEPSIQVGSCITYLNEKCMVVRPLPSVF